MHIQGVADTFPHRKEPQAVDEDSQEPPWRDDLGGTQGDPTPLERIPRVSQTRPQENQDCD